MSRAWAAALTRRGGDNAGLVDHFVLNGDEAGTLHDLQAVVVDDGIIIPGIPRVMHRT